MENTTILTNEKNFFKQLFYYLSCITTSQFLLWILCFIFARANLFGVIKPFAPSFYVSAGFSGISGIAAIISITIGNLVFSNIYETIRQTVALLIFEAVLRIVFQKSKTKETQIIRSALMSGVIFLTGILRGAAQGLRLYDVVVSFISASLVFSFSVIMSPAVKVFFNNKGSVIFKGKELFSSVILLCFIIISLKGINIWFFDLGSIFAGLFVIIIARSKGVPYGACTGAIFGILIALYDIPDSLNTPGMLALSGAAAGLNVKSKTAVLTLWSLVLIIFSGLSLLGGGLPSVYYEGLMAAAIFYIIPNAVLKNVSRRILLIKKNYQETSENAYDQKNEAADNLYVLSKALSRFSRSLEETITEEALGESSEIQWMIEIVAEKVCNLCSHCNRCWEINLVKTYRLVEKSITELKTDDSGRLECPVWFKNICSKSNMFFEALQMAYSLYKAENIWRKRLFECRMLLAKQAELLSGTMMSAARNILDTSNRDKDLENRLLYAMENHSIPVSAFRCQNIKGSNISIDAIYNAKAGVNINYLDKLMCEILNTSLIRTSERRRDITGYSILRYMKQPKLKAVTGIARINRENNAISGDSFTFFTSPEGFHISAIIDGMGSGKRAERYSRTAIQLLENIIDDGAPMNMAISLTDLFLNSRGENERLAALDIFTVDLSRGSAYFYKHGALCSFVKGKKGVVTIQTYNDKYNLESLFKSEPLTMEEGDFAILVSDGVLEAYSALDEVNELKWFIEKQETPNAQEMAEYILDEAKRRSFGKHDDMTVLVTKLW